MRDRFISLLYQAISGLADLTQEHPALRNGAHQHRYAADGSGIYGFSRIDREEQREYVRIIEGAARRLAESLIAMGLSVEGWTAEEAS